MHIMHILFDVVMLRFLSELFYLKNKSQTTKKGKRKMNSGFVSALKENVVFAVEFLAVIVAAFVVAYVAERYFKKKNGDTEKILATRKITVIGMFSAIAVILYMLDFPLPFAPGFYKMDFSELPALVGAFAFGPVAGVLIEFVKVLLKLLFQGTSTAFVGDLANFLVGCCFILPAAILYQANKKKKTAIFACVLGTVVMTFVGTTFNAVYLLPKFAQLYGMPLDAIIGMGTAINPAITNVTSFVICAVAPLNILKGTSISLITLLIYKKLSPILKAGKNK